ncbi:60S ribosomal export protein NMD3 [Durusdinium trenchii]|uniref:60S ribosomal export protein NMD3 n=1 Tax=Durusdinium trenchii TaxID=1381693 RepID=A0ABP0MKI8_9DINO
MVKCCLCGVQLSAAVQTGARCVQCLRKEVDVGASVHRRGQVHRCNTCQRWLRPNGGWTVADPESRELLGICLKNVKGIGRELQLVTASFLWTEPHSKELKLKLELQQEVITGVVVRQAVVVELRIQNLQCPDCKKSYTKHLWDSSVQGVYDVESYEKDMGKVPEVFTVQGGVFLEAVSVCHVELGGPTYEAHCFNEASYAAEQLAKSSKSYVIVAACALEEPTAPKLLARLVELPQVRGIRQILNHQPDWPRNARLGDLLENVQWRQGFSTLHEYGLSFDLQLNFHQFKKAAELLSSQPEISVIIDHLGSPRLEDLSKEEYWEGLLSLAACPKTYMKISMLSYIHKAWDQEPSVLDAVHRIIRLFGVERCMFASNTPVDQQDAWPPDRLYAAFWSLAQPYGPESLRELFAGTARRAYRM